MRDIELYSKLLLLEWPWQVDDIEMDEKGREIHVMVEMEAGAKLPCPDRGRAGCSVSLSSG
jgi:hypothetical protein